MRRRRPRRRKSVAPVLLSTALGALAGLAVGALLMQQHGRLTTSLRRMLRETAAEEDQDGNPPDSVYEMDRLAHDESDYGDAEDDIEDGETEDAVAAELEKRVLDTFLNDPVLSHCSIEIRAESDGLVELDGWVEDRAELKHAETLAGGVPGVVAVANNIRVRRARRASTS